MYILRHGNGRRKKFFFLISNNERSLADSVFNMVSTELKRN
jgi:hypothetical protein